MNRIYKIFKLIHYSIWIALLSFTLVLGVVPAIAQNNSLKTQVLSTDASHFLVKGKAAYELGRFAEAEKYWEQALQYYQQVEDVPHQALSLNYLSLVFQELGQWKQAEKSINQSINLIQEYGSDKNSTSNVQGIMAQVLNTQGNLQLTLGKEEMALDSWQQAERYYRQEKDQIGLLGSKINQAQALQNLGFYRRAQKILEELHDDLENQDDLALKALGLRSLGNALQVTGNLTESQEILQESLALVQSLGATEANSATLFSLGNVARASENYDSAIAFYQQAADMTSDPLTKVEGNLNQMSLLSTQQEWQKIKQLIPVIQSDLSNLPASRKAIYAQVNFAKNLINLAAQEAAFARYDRYSQELLNKTINQARQLEDLQGQSYALGTLGYWYEQKREYSRGEKTTEEALNLAVDIQASDIAYQWQWQLGRLLKKQGDIPGAIAAETEAVTALQSIRGDLVAINPDLQFSFRESVEPIYRDLVELLVSYDPNQNNLLQAREVIESLQLAELENYFREACIDAKPKQIEEIDDKAAVIYPIILPERLAVIVSVPDSSLMYYEQSLPEAEIEKTLDKFSQSLNPIYSNKQRLKLSQQIYDWLIKPGEAELAKHNIETLVFVLDGSLRNLPMTALYDGQKYLVEKYKIALTPGLQLLESQTLENQELQAVVAGLSEASQGFSALPGVETEVNEISQYIPSQLLINEQFTNISLREQIRETSSSLVHLATHGQFSSNPEETFIVTWNDQINVKELEDLLKVREETENAQPIELLVMSACQTAVGDKRATLGIAGVAVRSGARSTIATLWSVKDESTVTLMDQFYQQLSENSSSMTKAEALRQAQISLIHSSNFNHPFYWSPFVLIGNWL